MLHALKCPSCSAPVDYDDDNHSRTLRCPFCNNTIVAPGDAGGRRPPQVSVNTVGVGRGDSAAVVRRALLVVPVVIIAGLVVTAVVAYKLVSDTTRQATRTIEVRQNDVAKTVPPRTNVEPKAPGFATVALKFGGEGIGPGLFTDARSIAVDGEGRIYVGDYTGGRIQVFDPAGKFITQWMVDAKMPLRGMAADRKGNVYIVQRGKILRYEGASGKQLGELSYAEGTGFDDVVVTADGGLVAAFRRHSDDIVRFDSSGGVVRTMRGAISSQTDRSELNMRVAVDGLGNVYALGTFNEAVLKFTPEGRFVTRIGSEGEQPGQFRAAGAVAVDSQGRVYVSDIKGVQVFDTNGRYLETFKPGGNASGMVFNDRNELFIAARTQVLKLALNK